MAKKCCSKRAKPCYFKSKFGLRRVISNHYNDTMCGEEVGDCWQVTDLWVKLKEACVFGVRIYVAASERSHDTSSLVCA